MTTIADFKRDKKERKAWRVHMRQWALAWRLAKEGPPAPQVEFWRTKPKPTDHFEEMRRLAGAQPAAEQSRALASAIRCRNRSMGMGASSGTGRSAK